MNTGADKGDAVRTLDAARALTPARRLAEDRVRTAILPVIIGQDFKEALKQSGIRAGTRLTYQVAEKIPASVLIRKVFAPPKDRRS